MDNKSNSAGSEIEMSQEKLDQEGEWLFVITVEDYYDLLMEQQEQM